MTQFETNYESVVKVEQSANGPVITLENVIFGYGNPITFDKFSPEKYSCQFLICNKKYEKMIADAIVQAAQITDKNIKTIGHIEPDYCRITRWSKNEKNELDVNSPLVLKTKNTTKFPPMVIGSDAKRIAKDALMSYHHLFKPGVIVNARIDLGSSYYKQKLIIYSNLRGIQYVDEGINIGSSAVSEEEVLDGFGKIDTVLTPMDASGDSFDVNTPEDNSTSGNEAVYLGDTSGGLF